jgi:hypothetical protein
MKIAYVLYPDFTALDLIGPSFKPKHRSTT